MFTWFNIIKTRMVNPFIHLVLEHVQIHVSHGGQCIVSWFGGFAPPTILLIVVTLIAYAINKIWRVKHE